MYESPAMLQIYTDIRVCVYIYYHMQTVTELQDEYMLYAIVCVFIFTPGVWRLLVRR